MPVEHHGFEAVTPEDLVGQVGRPGLEGESGGFDGALHGHVDLEVGRVKVRGTQPMRQSQA